MKNILTAILVGTLVLSLTACDESSYSTSGNTSSETIDNILGEIGKFLDNNLDKDEDISYTIAGVEFSIPFYYNEKESSDDGTYFYYQVDETRVIVLMIMEDLVSISEEEFNEEKDKYVDILAESTDTGAFNSKDITLASLPGKFFMASDTLDDGTVRTVYFSFAYNPQTEKMLYVIMSAWRPDLLSKDMAYVEDYNKIIETAKLIPQNAPDSSSDSSTASPSEDTPPSKSVSYSTNDLQTAKNGNSGVFAYKKSGSYNIYYIIDFDEGYVYRFMDGNGEEICDRLKIDSGDLNSTLIVTYHSGNDSWSNALHFKWKNRPDIMILEDGYDEYRFTTTDLDDALAIRDTKTIKDY